MKTRTTDEICSKIKKELSFQFLNQDDEAVLEKYLDCLQVSAGETLWREGEGCGELAFIVTGRLEVSKETEFEGKNVIVGVYGAGSIVGELCILKAMPRIVTAVALTDCELLTLSADNFNALTEKHPALGVRLLKGMLATVSIRLSKAFSRLASIF
jgi:CRP/FNR family transcriptional regulator, cyclic AMP receptor protein